MNGDAAGRAASGDAVGTPPCGRVLIVAGSDSGGGAGIQADIKTVTCLGGYAMTAVTALTAQNTMGVSGIHPIPPDFVTRQIAAVADDLGVDVVKTGMLADAATIRAVAAALARHCGDAPLVLDPVMVAKGGQSLVDDTAAAALRDHLLPRAALITPNAPEAGVLLGRAVSAATQAAAAARDLLALGPRAVLLKGGHLPGETVEDLLVWRNPSGSVEEAVFRHPRLAGRHTHGTGCTLASAIATGLAQGLALERAVQRATDYVHAAMLAAPGFGQGHGPLGHGVTVRPF